MTAPSSTTVYGPTATFEPNFALGAIMAVGWIVWLITLFNLRISLYYFVAVIMAALHFIIH